MSTRKPRGLGAKPALIKISVRVSAETLAYYKQYPSYTHAMREVLEAEIRQYCATCECILDASDGDNLCCNCLKYNEEQNDDQV